MNSNFLKLNLRDIARSVIIAVLATIFAKLASDLNAPGFGFADYAWVDLIRLAVTTAFGVLSASLISTKDNKILGKI